MKAISKSKLALLCSLAILGVLLGFTVLKPVLAGDSRYTEVYRGQLLEKGDEWIVELHLKNPGSGDQEYSIGTNAGGEYTREPVIVKAGSSYRYIYHLKKASLTGATVNFDIYRANDAEPFERVTYSLH